METTAGAQRGVRGLVLPCICSGQSPSEASFPHLRLTSGIRVRSEGAAPAYACPGSHACDGSCYHSY